jgi:hypothetical protein
MYIRPQASSTIGTSDSFNSISYIQSTPHSYITKTSVQPTDTTARPRPCRKWFRSFRPRILHRPIHEEEGGQVYPRKRLEMHSLRWKPQNILYCTSCVIFARIFSISINQACGDGLDGAQASGIVLQLSSDIWVTESASMRYLRICLERCFYFLFFILKSTSCLPFWIG